jgi:hypothetical protein
VSFDPHVPNGHLLAVSTGESHNAGCVGKAGLFMPTIRAERKPASRWDEIGIGEHVRKGRCQCRPGDGAGLRQPLCRENRAGGRRSNGLG